MVHRLFGHSRHAGRPGGPAVEHRLPLRRRAGLAGGRHLLRRGPRPADLLPRLRQRRPVRLDPVVHLRHRRGAAARAVQRGLGGKAVHGLVHRPPVPRGRHDAGGVLPVQPDRVVSRVAVLSRPAAPGAGGPDAPPRAADGQQRQVPQVSPDRAAQRQGPLRAGGAPHHPARRDPRTRVFSVPIGAVLHDLRPGPCDDPGAHGAPGAGRRHGRAAGARRRGRRRPAQPPTPIERRANWLDRRQKPED